MEFKVSAAAPAASEIIPDEKRSLEKRRTVRRDDTNASAPATKIAGRIPYQQAIKKTKASERVKVILSRLILEGSVKVLGNRLMTMIAGRNEIRINSSRPLRVAKRMIAAASHKERPTTVTAV